MLTPVIMRDAENNEDYPINGDADEDNSEYDSVNGDTDTDSSGAENTRTNNSGKYNADDDIDATDNDDGDSVFNDNGYPYDTYSHHAPAFMSSVDQICLALYMYAFMNMTLL